MEKKFHDGELKIQQLLGEEEIANSNSRLISPTIAKGATAFIENQSQVVISSVDVKGNIWCSLLLGKIGFTTISDLDSISFDTQKIYSNPEDVFYNNAKANPRIGSLFIEFATRKRYRINGFSFQVGPAIIIKLDEAYSNCPKYIQQHVIYHLDSVENLTFFTKRGKELSESELSWITSADTFFVGSSSQSGKLDASHRGGNPGFIELLSNNTLKIPDYQGNSLYNTLGNIASNPNVGLLFIDFENGHTLQLTGKAELFFEKNPETDFNKSITTGRYWLFQTEQWIRTENRHKVESTF